MKDIQKNKFLLINLLPYREEVKKQRKTAFAINSALAAVLGGVVLFAATVYLSGIIDDQTQRNVFFKNENKKLDTEISEIKDLKDQIRSMIDRKRVVENLQLNRSDAINVMNELARRLPEGIFLKSVNQIADKLTISGYAQQASKVSIYMQDLDKSDWLTNPELIEVKSTVLTDANKKSEKINEFSFVIQLKRQKVVFDELKDEAKKSDTKSEKASTPAKDGKAPDSKSNDKAKK